MSGSSSYRISIASSNSSIVCGSVAGIFDISVTISSNSVLRLRAVAHGLTGGSPMLELSVMCGVAGCFVLLWVPACAGMTGLAGMTGECAGASPRVATLLASFTLTLALSHRGRGDVVDA